MKQIPQDRLDALKRLGVAYYEAREAIGREFLDAPINPASHTADGVLDRAAYTAALVEVLEYVDGPALTFDARCPTESEPDHVWTIQIFGGHIFECRRRLRSMAEASE
jgi:hypothetical protein